MNLWEQKATCHIVVLLTGGVKKLILHTYGIITPWSFLQSVLQLAIKGGILKNYIVIAWAIPGYTVHGKSLEGENFHG